MTTDPKTVWEIPDPTSTHDVPLGDGTVVTLRRHGNPDGPRLVLSHGNGLAVDLYYPFWSRLTNDFDLVVYDLRNHGWNAVTSLQEHNIPTLVRDHDLILDAIDTHYGNKPKVGVFHSVSALIALLSPARGSGWSALVLFDPPLCKPGASFEEFDAAAMRAAEMTRRRTFQFRSREDFAYVLPFMPTFKHVVPGVPELMAQTTLREAEEGEGYELRCPRDYEAQIMDYARLFSVTVEFESLACPIKVVGADPTLPYSYLPTLDLNDILEVDYDFLPDATHFLPLEKPEECVAALRDFLKEIGSL